MVYLYCEDDKGGFHLINLLVRVVSYSITFCFNLSAYLLFIVVSLYHNHNKKTRTVLLSLL